MATPPQSTSIVQELHSKNDTGRNDIERVVTPSGVEMHDEEIHAFQPTKSLSVTVVRFAAGGVKLFPLAFPSN